MTILDRLIAQPLQNIAASYTVTIPQSIPEGLTFIDDVMVFRNGDKITAYDRRCDHNGGKLVSRPGTSIATCPLHGWTFNPENGAYTNVAAHKRPLEVVPTRQGWEARVDSLTPILEGGSEAAVTVRFLNHACVVVSSNGVSFATDPWLFGPAFCNGWWLKYESPKNAIDILNQCDFIFVSHNHPDHLHPETLSKVRKDMPMVTAGFATGSSEAYLKDLGFSAVMAADFGSFYHDPVSDLRFTALKSGDFRDDSGLYFTIGAFSGLFAVDCNFLNFNALPSPVTFLASAFAGGASAFPLCFTNLDDLERQRILVRNKAAMMAGVRNYLDASRPSVFMPYAGYFAEDPIRDAFVASSNVKHAPGSYLELCNNAGVVLADPTIADTYTFIGDKLLNAQQLEERTICRPDPEYYSRAWEKYGEINFSEIEAYFQRSGYKDNLIAYFGLTDEDFNPQVIYEVDFRGDTPAVRCCDAPVLSDVHAITGARTTYGRIRTPAFIEVVRELLPWEDLLIGFQGRFDRVPNTYDSDFWFHFTNVHIKQHARRSISNCGGSCNRIDEAVY